MLYNDFQGITSKDMLKKFRSSRQDEDIPIFLGSFILKKSQFSFINDSKIKDLTKKHHDEHSEISVFSNNFSISYSHYDALDL
jgi:hypothetical protein